MSTPPEVLFHRFFQIELSGLEDRQTYKGKQDLDLLQPTVRSLLVVIQNSLNEALLNEKRNVPEHVDHPPFHFDYIDSNIPNAVAFRYEGYSFIGITMALINKLWDTCVRLSRSEAIATLMRICLTPEEYEAIHVVFFRTQLNFVVSHEYTHHVHGHVTPLGSVPEFCDEILAGSETGSLKRQAREVDADGYATYLVLAHLFDSEWRSHAVKLLNCERESGSVQDEVLISAFVVVVGAFFFVRPPVALDNATVFDLTHPPQAARMNFVMENVMGWCKQNRPNMSEFMTKDRFNMLMSAAADATWGMNGGRSWGDQIAFLQSHDGSQYSMKLDECAKAQVLSL